jgi:hypothetical protein
MMAEVGFEKRPLRGTARGTMLLRSRRLERLANVACFAECSRVQDHE